MLFGHIYQCYLWLQSDCRAQILFSDLSAFVSTVVRGATLLASHLTNESKGRNLARTIEADKRQIRAYSSAKMNECQKSQRCARESSIKTKPMDVNEQTSVCKRERTKWVKPTKNKEQASNEKFEANWNNRTNDNREVNMNLTLPLLQKKRMADKCRLSILNWHFRVTYPLAPCFYFWSEAYSPCMSFFYSAGARDKWSQSPIKETKIKLHKTLCTRKPREIPTSHLFLLCRRARQVIAVAN